MRLEWAQDQWYAAMQRQEYAKQASLESLLGRTSGITTTRSCPTCSMIPRHRRTMAMALGFSGRRKQSRSSPSPSRTSTTRWSSTACSRSTSSRRTTRSQQDDRKGPRTPVIVDPEIVVPYLRHPRPEVRSNAALVLSKTLGRNPRSPCCSWSSPRRKSRSGDARPRRGGTRHDGRPRGLPVSREGAPRPVQLVRIRAALGSAA